MSIKWKFFHNGYTWWLRIETLEQLIKYCEQVDEHRFGGAMMTVAYHRMDGNKKPYNNKHDGFAADLDTLNGIMAEDLLTTTAKLRLMAHETYLKNFMRFGFVNINKFGGCNSCDWPMNIVINKNDLIFPLYSRKDVTIKTFQIAEAKVGVYRPYYQYHWYAYIGDVQLKNGDIEKWNTRDEAEKFVDSLFIET